MPDLLQTPAYMRAAGPRRTPATGQGAQRAHAVEVKLNRQRIVLAGRAPRLEVVITEGALRQAVGPPRVMREQLGWLADVAETGVPAAR